MGFSTLNESNLHNTLKIMYCEIYEGKMEVEQDGHIYDIQTKNGNIIEIQTKNLGKLLPKIIDTINKGHKIKIVHPVIISNRIELYDSETKLISSRKSPKKGSIYSMIDELAGIYQVITNPNFSLEIIEITMIEQRIRTEEKVQSKNNRRRFKRNWNKINKKLDQIIDTKRFSSKEDYQKLLPPLPDFFCAKDLKEALKNQKNLPASAVQKANYILWVFSRADIITYVKTENRNKYYRINQ